jgi:hypothetical protein
MKQSAQDLARENQWQAEEDLRCLTRCVQIKKDKPRYARAVALAREQAAALHAVASTTTPTPSRKGT